MRHKMPPKIRPLSEALALKASVELNEHPDRIQGDLDAIREWLKKTPHLRCRQDDQFLVAFLRGCKYRLEKVKEKLDMYYTVRSTLPEITTNRDPLDPKIQEIIRLGVVLPLPTTLQPDGDRIVLVRPGGYDPKHVRFEQVIQLGTMINDLLNMEDDNFAISGLTVLVNFANVTPLHLAQMKPTMLSKIFTLLQDASLVRFHAVHLINLPPTFETVYSMAMGMLSEKNQASFATKIQCHFHGSVEHLSQSIPRSVLPKEMGGQNESMEVLIQECLERLVQMAGYFAEERLYGVDEKKRVGPNKYSRGLSGMQGSFSKLEID